MKNRIGVRIGIRNQELDCNLDRIVTGRPLEAYDHSLVRRPIFWSQCQSLDTSIEVHVNTFVSPIKDLYKSAH